MNAPNQATNTLINQKRPVRRRLNSFRHFWLSLRHALRWSQLKQSLHYKNVWAFTKRHWFGAAVLFLLTLIAYRFFPPFTQPAQVEGSSMASLSPLSSAATSRSGADFAPHFAEKDATEKDSQEQQQPQLPPDLPQANQHQAPQEQGSKLGMEYMKRFAKVAQDEEKKYGIPAAIILGLAALSSEYGSSDDATRYNNHFSIICEDNLFKAEVQLITKNGACHLEYPTAWAGFRANSMLLTSGKYKELAKIAKKDINTWASGLERIGCPHPNFSAEELLNIIKIYNLEKYNK